MLHNAVVLYRRTITFSYAVSTNHKSRLHIPIERSLGSWERTVVLAPAPPPAPRALRITRENVVTMRHLYNTAVRHGKAVQVRT